MTELLTSARKIKELLARNGFAPRKSLGQNFLLDRNILKKIAAAAALDRTDLVLEIGPGLGSLTGELLECAGRVVAVEYDRGLCSILSGIFAGNERLKLLQADFMQVDLSELLKQAETTTLTPKAVANLPYYITTPVIFKLLESGIDWACLVFLVQKEVAQRMAAAPGGKEYGALTVMLNYYGQVELLATVSQQVFYPRPQVDSALIRIRPHRQDWRPLYPWLHRTVQAAFGQRRKTIVNALAAGLRYERAAVMELLEYAGIDPARRGETLAVPEFVRLAERVAQIASER
jgi:16S rRNA (adenine1518-N6/adenine1519-N6)-dimethyltransferase